MDVEGSAWGLSSLSVRNLHSQVFGRQPVTGQPVCVVHHFNSTANFLWKQQKKTIAKQLASEIAKINALADDPKNFYTEEDRKGAIVAATKKIKSNVKGAGIPFTFDFSRIANQINKDTFAPYNISRVLKQEAKKKKQKYID